MIAAANDLAAKYHSSAHFLVMNAMHLDFPDNSFDAIVTRNLTWTLPDVPLAYREWFRVLKPGGVLINFDANYGDNVRYEQNNSPVPSQDTPFGHPASYGCHAERKCRNHSFYGGKQAKTPSMGSWSPRFLRIL